KAFQSAWKAACTKETDNVKITVPNGKTFLVYAVKFEGPCKSSSITFEILGRIVAPPRSAWRKKSTDEWLYFHRVDGLIVEGNGQGQIDGVGSTWWKQAMRFSHCNGLQLRGLKYINSQQNHISINACNKTSISKLDIRAPQKSPNTDGIDISASIGLHIHDCVMATGDDCIAINGGTSDVNISNIACGPGHGISIGSLGKKGHHDEVQRINITNCSFNRTQNGVRIKTWQGGAGFAKNIIFSNITFIEANNPVIIDQFYCPHQKCETKKSAVQVSDVRFSGLHGTSSCKNATINLSCSETVPCKNIILEDVNIKSANPHNSTSAYCINAHGLAHTSNPVVSCLKN
ncbi:probable polygalacturonase at3g15720, partial [Phtheirospermum japonicum]